MSTVDVDQIEASFSILLLRREDPATTNDVTSIPF